MHNGKIVGNLVAMLIRERRAWKSGGLTVGGDVEQRRGGSARVGAVKFEVASPLKADLVDPVAGKT